MVDLSWILDSESYNPSYPFTAYGYLIAIAISIHLIMVIWPMIKIYRRFTKEHIKSIAKEVKKALTEEQRKDLKDWIKSEIFYMLFPFFIALTFRFISGSPDNFEWTNLTVIVGLALATIWISLQIWQAIEMNRILNPLLSKWRNPKLLSGGLGLFNITKSRMEILSKLEANYVDINDEEMESVEPSIDGTIDEDRFDVLAKDVKKTGIKAVKAIYNIGQFGKSLFAKANKKTVEIVDKKIQQKVDQITKPKLHTKLKGRIITFTLALLPLIAIYLILPNMS